MNPTSFSTYRKPNLLTKQLMLFSLVILFGLHGMEARGQEACKVLMPEISGTYKGKCKNGLADGKGKAKGIDTYVGMFRKGLPDGKGKYTYKNGNVYIGYWSKGVKEGTGEFFYSVNGKKSVLRGYWKNGEYVGLSAPDEFYRMTNQTGITNYSIRKLKGDQQQIVISFVNQVTKYIPGDLSLDVSSGKVERQNIRMVVTQFVTPVRCSIHYTIRMANMRKQCFLGFDILKPGNYEVVITNE